MPELSLGKIASWPASIGDAWMALVRTPDRRLLAVVAILNFLLTLSVEFGPFHNFPNSGDEYSYFVSAELFSRGKLSVPSPPMKEFFEATHVVNDGKFYGKYPPGWPLLLAAGVFLRLPWLVNPLLGALTLVAIDRLARAHFSTETANTAVLMCLGNPYFLFNSASYFSHPACLLFVTLSFHFALNCLRRPEDWESAVGLGLAAGGAFVTRPFTTMVFLVPAAGVLAVRRLREPGAAALLRPLALAALPFAACLALFLLYNKAQTGDAFLQPFQKYDPSDKPGLPHETEEWSDRFRTHVGLRLWQLNRWLPLSVLLLLFAVGIREVRRNPIVRAFLVGLGAMFVAFFCYWGDGIVQYGPRYLYEGFSAMVLASAAVVTSFGPRGLLIVLGMATLGTTTFIDEVREVEAQISKNQSVWTEARRLGLSEAIVFTRSGWTTGPLWGSPGSVLAFDASVLVVRDRGDENPQLLRRYPGRKAYYFDFDDASRTGRIVPVGRSTDGK
jgi:hypothetical protein